jgi:Ribbon-helix-helix protein, copG family
MSIRAVLSPNGRSLSTMAGVGPPLECPAAGAGRSAGAFCGRGGVVVSLEGFPAAVVAAARPGGAMAWRPRVTALPYLDLGRGVAQVTASIQVRESRCRRCVAAKSGVRQRARMSDESKLKSVSVRLDDALRERLEELARAEDRPLSYVIRRTLRAAAARTSQTQGQAA